MRRSKQKVVYVGSEKAITLFLNLKQAADELGLSHSTITKMVQRGEIPAHRFSKRTYLIERQQWEEWKARRLVPTY
jgi:excisionase family DNA binding protein